MCMNECRDSSYAAVVAPEMIQNQDVDVDGKELDG